MNGDQDIESLDRTVVRVGDNDVPITRADAKAIQVALLDYLNRSNYESRDELLGWTRGPASIDSDGTVRIGPWVLSGEPSGLILRYREPPGPLSGKAHKAYLTHERGAWAIKDMRTERIHRRL